MIMESEATCEDLYPLVTSEERKCRLRCSPRFRRARTTIKKTKLTVQCCTKSKMVELEKEHYI